MTGRELRFTHEDMELFAAASGDRSPLHTDPAFARRTAFGACIVYGGLESIAMLGALPDEALARIRRVRSSFPGPVLPNELLSVAVRSRDDRAEWEVRLTGRGKLVARLLASAGGGPSPEVGGEVAAGDEIVTEYRPGPELDELARRFGVARLDRAVLEGIAWASNVVGTTIPDFDGLCAAVTIVAARAGSASAAARQNVAVRGYDERTDLVLIDGMLSDEAGVPRCLGTIECFPFSPTPLPESAALAPAGALDPIQGTVVVVGASRGLGAALSLALLARGYVVHGIHSGASEAAGELTRLAGPYAERLFLRRLDAGDSAATAQLVGALGSAIDGLALCAAPPALPMALTAETADTVADYVARSIRLAAVPLASFVPRLARDRGWVLFCSAAAAVDPPADLPQLATAKAALEGLARWVASRNPAARVLVVRPPKLRTDSANTPAARAAAADPLAIAQEIVQRLGDDEQAAGLSIVPLGARPPASRVAP